MFDLIFPICTTEIEMDSLETMGQWTETDRTKKESSREFKGPKENKKGMNNEVKGAKQPKAANQQASARTNTYILDYTDTVILTY